MNNYFSENISQTACFFRQLQSQICDMLETEDGQQKFIEDNWTHRSNISGTSCILVDGPVIEKAGVNFSHVHGDTLPEAATRVRTELKGCQYQALGISLVIHPRNPFAPTSHANLRLFTAHKPSPNKDKSTELIWWFGGGLDLTPYYGFVEDCQHWHRMAKAACDPFGPSVYPTYKQQCDDYFFLKHRNEPRGIGGLFFDDLNDWGFDTCFTFIKTVGKHFLLAYQPILSKRKNHVYTDKQRDFQSYRRGRYVEFNLVYDRGTAFGLQSGGRTESILMSLPPSATWLYNWSPEANTPEAELYEKFLIKKEWI